MRISLSVKDSLAFKLSKKLFVDDNQNAFRDSKVLKVLNYCNNQYISIGALALSVVCLLYKSFLVGTWLDSYNVWFVFLVIALLFCDKKEIKSHRSIIFLIALIGASLISSIVAAICGVQLVVLMNGLFLFSVFPLFLIITSTYSAGLYKIIITAILIAVLPLMIAGIWQLFDGSTTPEYWVSTSENLISLRIFGWSENPNTLGALSMLTGLMSLFLGMRSKKWPYFVYFVLAIFVMILTFSRASWLGLIIGLAVVILIKNWRFMWLLLLGIPALLVPSVNQRLVSTFNSSFLSDSAFDGRLWTLNSIKDLFYRSPIIGIGPGTYGNDVAKNYISPAYSMLSQNGFVTSYMVDMQWPLIMSQTGVVGILCVAGFFISYFINMLGFYRKSKDIMCLGFIAVLVAMFVVGLLENVWFFAPMASIFGIFLGIGIGYKNAK